MSLSTFSFSSRVGRRVMSLESSGNTKRHCRSVDGQTGFSATHDRPRIASRVGPAQARLGAMLLLTLRGTPTRY